jgi:hypothetical protein
MNFEDTIIAEANNWLPERGLDHIKPVRLSKGANGLMMWGHEHTDQAKPPLDKANEAELRTHLIEYGKKLRRDGSNDV